MCKPVVFILEKKKKAKNWITFFFLTKDYFLKCKEIKKTKELLWQKGSSGTRVLCCVQDSKAIHNLTVRTAQSDWALRESLFPNLVRR